MTTLQELVRDLARAKRHVETCKGLVKSFEEQIAETDLGCQLEEERAGLRWAQGIEAEARAALEQAALAEYDGENNRPHPAIGIRVTKRLQYESQVAEAWARENMPTALNLDAKRFENGVKALSVPSFAFVMRAITVTVAVDLSQYTE